MKTRRHRKNRKTKRKKRGGDPIDPINTPIYYTVTGMDPDEMKLSFRPSYVLTVNGNGPDEFKKREDLKKIFIQNINEYKDIKSESLDEDIKIFHIHDGLNDSVYQGKMADWSYDQMKTFLVRLRPEDKMRIEILPESI